MNWQVKKNWVHIIGISGKATAQVAIALKLKGWEVSGSDETFGQPTRGMLQAQPEIKLFDGYKYTHLIKEEGEINHIPELVIAQGGLSRQNKEIKFAQKRNLKIEHFPKLLNEELVVDESIVVAGSFGKTTTTGLLIKILTDQDVKISYAVGGKVSDLENGVKFKDDSTEYSICEGDEYISSRDDMQSKFFYYKPKYLVLTGYAYDHTDIFKTKEDYYDNFKKLVESIPEDGVIIYNSKYKELISLSQSAKCKTIPYGFEEQYFESNLIGDFNQENIKAALTISEYLGFNTAKAIETIKNFKGVSRRLEIIYKTDDSMIVDDFGSTPGKARSAIREVQKIYPEYELNVIFEPNLGSRTMSALLEFEDVFNEKMNLYLKKFQEVKSNEYMSEIEFKDELLKTNPHLRIEVLREHSKIELAEKIKSDKKTILLILSSNPVDDLISEIEERING